MATFQSATLNFDLKFSGTISGTRYEKIVPVEIPHINAFSEARISHIKSFVVGFPRLKLATQYFRVAPLPRVTSSIPVSSTENASITIIKTTPIFNKYNNN